MDCPGCGDAYTGKDHAGLSGGKMFCADCRKVVPGVGSVVSQLGGPDEVKRWVAAHRKARRR